MPSDARADRDDRHGLGQFCKSSLFAGAYADAATRRSRQVALSSARRRIRQRWPARCDGVATVLRPHPRATRPCPPSRPLPTFPATRRRSARGRTCLCCCRAGASAKQRRKVARGSDFELELRLTMASGGDPMGATTTGPRVSSPKTCAGRGAVKVTMASARTIPSPGCGVIASESAPDGMSTATTGLAAPVHGGNGLAIQALHRRGLKPVPRIASTSSSQLARLRDDSACSSCEFCMMMGRSGSRSNMAAHRRLQIRRAKPAAALRPRARRDAACARPRSRRRRCCPCRT